MEIIRVLDVTMRFSIFEFFSYENWMQYTTRITNYLVRQLVISMTSFILMLDFVV